MLHAAGSKDHRCAREPVALQDQAGRLAHDVLARVAHELRTPLNAVLGFAQLLACTDDAAMRGWYTGQIELAARHLAALVEDMASLEPIAAGGMQLHLEDMPVRDVVNEALSIVHHAASRASVELVVAQGDSSTLVRADRVRLREILLNLMTNAIKYNRPAGTVNVWWWRDVAACRACIAVRDEGRGLAATQLTRLFQPFERLGAERSSIEGCGLGLAISKRLAARMEGDIEVDSEVGAGSTFTIWLPSPERAT